MATVNVIQIGLFNQTQIGHFVIAQRADKDKDHTEGHQQVEVVNVK